MQRIIGLIFFVLTLTLAAHAESRYVTDNVLIALRPAPNDTSVPLEQIATGTRVEVVEDLGLFLKIKSPAGTIGFARSKYFIPAPPAGRTGADTGLQGELTAALQRNVELTAELQQLKSTPAAAASAVPSQELEKSRSETAAITQERDQLKLEVARLTQSSKPSTLAVGQWASPFQWFLAGGAILLFGWFAGRSSRPKRRF